MGVDYSPARMSRWHFCTASRASRWPSIDWSKIITATCQTSFSYPSRNILCLGDTLILIPRADTIREFMPGELERRVQAKGYCLEGLLWVSINR